MKLCVIPARGGSKRIPRKNINPFLGKPIILYTIETVNKSNLFDEIMVSTDDDEIAEISRNAGVQVPFKRSEKNSNDYASTSDVLLEILDFYYQKRRIFDYLCCCYPTAPFMKVEKLIQGYELLQRPDVQMVYPVAKFEVSVFSALKIDKNGFIHPLFEERILNRSQDFEELYYDAGQWYWIRVKDFLKEKSLEKLKTMAVLLKNIEVQDINDYSDWLLAELKYKFIHNL